MPFRLALAFLALSLPAQAFEIGQIIGTTEDYGIVAADNAGKAVATLRSAEEYDEPKGGYAVKVDWEAKGANWDGLYSVQCVESDGIPALALHFGSSDGIYDPHEPAPATGPRAFMADLYALVCAKVPGAVAPLISRGMRFQASRAAIL